MNRRNINPKGWRIATSPNSRAIVTVGIAKHSARRQIALFALQDVFDRIIEWLTLTTSRLEEGGRNRAIRG